MELAFKKPETDSELRGKAYVHWKSWQEAYSGIVEQKYLDERTVERCEETARQAKENTIIAKDGDRVVGFVMYGACRDEDLENTGEVTALYVLADYYGQGIGYRLLSEALDRLRDYPRIALWVFQKNERAIAFYKRQGFRFDGHRGNTQVHEPVVRMLLTR